MFNSVRVVVLLKLCQAHGDEQLQQQVAHLQAQSARTFHNSSWPQNSNAQDHGDEGQRDQDKLVQKRSKFPQHKVGSLEIPLANSGLGSHHTTNINFFVNELPRINAHVESAAKRADEIPSIYEWNAFGPQAIAESIGSFLEHSRERPPANGGDIILSPDMDKTVTKVVGKENRADRPTDKLMVAYIVGGVLGVGLIIAYVLWKSNKQVQEVTSSDTEDEPPSGKGKGKMMLPGMMPPGMMQPGMQPGMMAPGMQPVMQPGMQPGMQQGMQPGMQPGMQQGIQPGWEQQSWDQQGGGMQQQSWDQQGGMQQQSWGQQGGMPQQQPPPNYQQGPMPGAPPVQGQQQQQW